jgi:alpha-tubulin suppressor-like RCC1 family protein
LKGDGTVWAWGNDGSGQVGDNATFNGNITTPVQVFGLTDITHIAEGLTHGLAVKNDGTVWACGYNSNGQLGNGNTTNQATPVQMTSVAGASKVAAGRLYSDSSMDDLSDEEVSRRARDNTRSPEERGKYQKEEKARGRRNVQKRARRLYILCP